MWAAGLLGLLLADGPAVAQRRDQTLVVSALDRDTLEPVRDLTSRDVVVREDGVAREVLRVSRLETPMHLAILVDDSSAARLHTSRLREGLSRFVRALGPAHEISLVTYANRPTLVVSFSRDREELEAGVARLFPTADSGAYLLDALEETANGFMKRESARPVIVVVDVLGEPLSYATYDRVMDRLLRSGAQLHVVQVAEPTRDTSQESIGGVSC